MTSSSFVSPNADLIRATKQMEDDQFYESQTENDSHLSNSKRKSKGSLNEIDNYVKNR
jgi:hypothetical protein